MKTTKKFMVMIVLNTILIIVGCGGENQRNWRQSDGYIPNEQSAIQLAELVWINIYGESIYDYKPFKVNLVDGNVWIVEGTSKGGQLGGAPYIAIQKKDAKIIKVSHGK